MMRVVYIPIFVVSFSLLCFYPAVDAASCEIVNGDSRREFDGEALDRVQIEKKSLTMLNREHPHLHAIERTFKGEIRTCTDCEGKHIVCVDSPNHSN